MLQIEPLPGIPEVTNNLLSILKRIRLVKNTRLVSMETGLCACNGACAWHCREQKHDYAGRVITVRWGDHVKRIGIDGSPDAIKDVISSAFGLRSRRPFWLEDEDGVLQSIDRDMPLKKYTLHLGQGLTIKMNLNDAAGESPVPGEDITFHVEEDFHYFLQRCGYIGLTDLSCGKNVHSFNDLHRGEIYQGYRDRDN